MSLSYALILCLAKKTMKWEFWVIVVDTLIFVILTFDAKKN